jgi:hypothetical protein
MLDVARLAAQAGVWGSQHEGWAESWKLGRCQVQWCGCAESLRELFGRHLAGIGRRQWRLRNTDVTACNDQVDVDVEVEVSRAWEELFRDSSRGLSSG